MKPEQGAVTAAPALPRPNARGAQTRHGSMWAAGRPLEQRTERASLGSAVGISRSRRERGAAAVEMAIVLPLLLLVIGGIVDFGRLFYAQIIVTSGAREGVRLVAMNASNADATTRVAEATPGLPGGLAPPSYARCPTSPSPTDLAAATVRSAKFDWLVLNALSGVIPGSSVPVPTPNSTAKMRCLG